MRRSIFIYYQKQKTRQIKKIVDSVNSTFSDIGKLPFELDKEKLGELLLKQTYPN